MIRKSIGVIFILFSFPFFGQKNILSDSNKEILNSSYKQNTHRQLLPLVPFSQKDSVNNPIIVQPIIEIRSGLGNNKPWIYSATLGIRAEAKINNKWTFQFNEAVIGESPEKHLSSLQDSLQIMLGVGKFKSYDNNSLGNYYSAKINFNPSPFFRFEIGRDKHFWGDGYRSLILSENSSPYPYFKINTKVWNIQYINLWTMMKDQIQGVDEKKFMALHALSWNFVPQWNLTFYETVIWQAKDSLNARNLDINYFNPVIFYRPVEHALGSADNVLVGASMSFQPSKNTLLYSQLLLDEFLFKEVKARNGWWANKFGLQLGVKSYNILHTNMDIQSEINFARPFTYSHGSILQNYGNQHQSIAHPLETNFVEWINNLRYSKDKWEVNNYFIWAIYGRDEYGENLGGNIYKPYTNVERNYGNYIAQGRKKTVLSNRLSFDRFLDPKKTKSIGLTNLCRYEGNNSENNLDIYLLLHVKFNPIPKNINR